MKRKFNIHTLLALFCTVAIAGCALCSINIAYGRYSTTITNDIGFKASLPPEVYLVQTDSESSRAEFTPQWQTVGGEKCLSFSLSNYDIDDEVAPKQDITVRIRVFVPETSAEAGDDNVAVANVMRTLAFTLHIGEEAASYSSSMDYLSEQTPMYMENVSDTDVENGGWIYSFHTAAMQEVSVALPGGELTDIPITITVADTDTDTSDFVICVDRIK